VIPPHCIRIMLAPPHGDQIVWTVVYYEGNNESPAASLQDAIVALTSWHRTGRECAQHTQQPTANRTANIL